SSCPSPLISNRNGDAAACAASCVNETWAATCPGAPGSNATPNSANEPGCTTVLNAHGAPVCRTKSAADVPTITGLPMVSACAPGLITRNVANAVGPAPGAWAPKSRPCAALLLWVTANVGLPDCAAGASASYTVTSGDGVS